jgi:hypothetical protein
MRLLTTRPSWSIVNGLWWCLGLRAHAPYAALSLGARMESAIAGNPDGIEAVFTLLHGLGVDALLTDIAPRGYAAASKTRDQKRLPTIYIGREVVDVGGPHELSTDGPTSHASPRAISLWRPQLVTLSADHLGPTEIQFNAPILKLGDCR